MGYIGILIMALFAAGAVFFFLVLTSILGPRKPNPMKDLPFECGKTPFKISTRQLPVHFYQIAMLFIIFDIELAFLFPWAVNFKQFGVAGLIQVVLFVFFILLGYLYMLKKKVLENI
nr:NADH:ubiquinone oxidoreductase subunit 3 [uncultured bacterium]